eukprot:1141414-Pelagomonas_calceolata.AAC.4
MQGQMAPIGKAGICSQVHAVAAQGKKAINARCLEAAERDFKAVLEHRPGHKTATQELDALEAVHNALAVSLAALSFTPSTKTVELEAVIILLTLNALEAVHSALAVLNAAMSTQKFVAARKALEGVYEHAQDCVQGHEHRLASYGVLA